MKNRFFFVVTLLVLLVTLSGNAQANTQTSPDSRALVYVNLGSPDALNRFASTKLPMYALLGEGLLSSANRAGQQALEQAGLTFQVVDTDLRSGTFYLAETHTSRPIPDFSPYGQVLLETPEGVLLRMDPSQVDGLTQAGAEVRLITLTPKALPAAQPESTFPDEIIPDPMIQLMMDQVTTEQAYEYLQGLAGEIPVWVDGDWYTIMSRNTNSGINIQKATSYVGQHLANLGLDVEYHQWNNSTNPNVIGERPGLVNPDDIFIIGGHVDDVQFTPGGADDNASGSVAAMVAADILTQYQWGCTLRFAVWTGEEQGLLGSDAYAQRSQQMGENIVGYLNLDMIAWNTIGSQPTIYLGYGTAVPSSHDLALLFADVVDAYNIDLLPVIGTAYSSSSDHGSFLQHGYPAILGIEGDDDFNPYYHGPGDITANTDPEYFTTYVKAAIGTFAHMTDCLIPGGVGYLDGHVTASDGGAPIEGATVVAESSTGYTYPATTDVSGYYTRTLMADTYTVTASAYGYLPFTETGLSIITDIVTTQDFSLLSAPTHIVSGTVTENGTGNPLLAEINFDGSPVVGYTDPATGHYEAELPEGSYTMHVKSDMHSSQERNILVDHDQTQNFALDPLPCILLVDDDVDNPDVRQAYTSALDDLGLGYTVWDTSSQGNPTEVDIAGYQQLMWFIGFPWSGTFTPENEAAVAAYLDAGGKFFLSSQDYLYEFGNTAFGQDYLHIGSYSSDVSQTTVTGQNVFVGLGPYTLSYPFTNYSDTINPNAQAQVAFTGNAGNAAVSFDGVNFKTTFFGFPFEALPNLAARSDVMDRISNDFFGGCEAPWAVSIDPLSDAKTGDPGTQVVYTYTVTNLGPSAQDVLLSVTGNEWVTEFPVSTGVLDSGASTTVPVTVTIPTELTGMSDHFSLNASGVEGGVASASGTTTANVHPSFGISIPPGGMAAPSEVASYEFTLTNAGDYTDTYMLETTGLWTVTLPGGGSTGPLAPGASTTFTLLVEVPVGAVAGETDVTTLTVTSVLDPSLVVPVQVTTTAAYVSILPIMMK